MTAIVTGGGGFLGGAIVRALVARGERVVSLSRGAYPELDALGVESRQVDLADSQAVATAFATVAERGSIDVCHHAAALAGVWGPAGTYERTNVVGTRNVLSACLVHDVSKLVYTSSPSVCFDGRDHINAGNDLPYAKRFLANYPETKARAEALVLAAHGPELATCALRPHLIFGPGDPHLLPRVIERARVGRLAIVGSGDNEVSMTYVDNAAHAHLLVADALSPDSAAGGKAYFIAQEEPVKLWPWIDKILAGVGVKPVRKRVPMPVAHAAGSVLELAWKVLGKAGEPPMTRFVASQLATSHSYDMEPARRDFGYREIVGMDEAIERTVADLRARGLCERRAKNAPTP